MRRLFILFVFQLFSLCVYSQYEPIYPTKPYSLTRTRIEDLDLKCQSIDLSRQYLTKLPEYLLKFKDLRCLNLMQNGLNLFECEQFLLRFPKLDSLYVAVHSITEIPKSLIPKIIGIEFMGFDMTGLNKILDIKSIRYLDLNTAYVEGGYMMKSIPAKILGLKDLEVLNIHQCALDSIPDGIINLVNLRELYVTENQIKYISPNISKLKNLKCIDLRRNNLSECPKELFEISGLESLSLFVNNVKSIPDDLSKL